MFNMLTNSKLRWAFALLIFQSIYQQAVGDEVQAVGAETEGETSSQDLCDSKKNLLKNPQFLYSKDRSFPNHWGASQHAGEPSFAIKIDSGALKVTKIGTQPWFLLIQKMSAVDWVGKKIRYTADIKLSLNANDLSHKFEPGGGLFLRVYGDMNPMGDDRLLLNSGRDHKPKLGITDWMPTAIEYILPEKANRLVVGLMHQANGSISIRNPSLSVICDK